MNSRFVTTTVVLLTLAWTAIPAGADAVVTERLRDDGIVELTVDPQDGRTATVYKLNLSKHHSPAREITPQLKKWESYRLGAFLCYNTNQFSGNEFCSAVDPEIYNPTKLDVAGWTRTIRKVGMRYAVLTVRHTSGFLLWDSPTTTFDVASSGNKTDVVKAFVENCRKHSIAPGLYYCLWGGEWKPNPKAREIILAQLYELTTNYGQIPYFWIDMNVWGPKNLTAQEIYDAIRNQQPQALVIFNQGTRDATQIQVFPTDILNGEITTPPEAGHQPVREIGGVKYYLPFEFEPVSQAREHGSVSATPYGAGAWFTYGAGREFPPSHPFPAEKLNDWIRLAHKRGAANVLLSLAPDYTGSMREEDIKALERLGELLRK